MPSPRKVKKPKPSTTENADIAKGWNQAIENRKPVYCEDRKAIVYIKI